MMKRLESMNIKFDEVLQHYFCEAKYVLEAVPFGLTNTTQVLEMNGQKYIVRIYNKYMKTIDSIELETQVTTFLDGRHLSFQVPVFLHTLSGENFVVLNDGSLAAVTNFIEGSIPPLSDLKKAKHFGRLVGTFSSEMSKLQTKKDGYYGISFSKIYDIHPLANRQSIKTFFENSPFELSDEMYSFYQRMITDVETSNLSLEVLPSQLVHHDLLIYNLLSRDDEIIGVLDFDFMGMDVAFMELAISFNHMIQESEGALDMIEAFLQGYSTERKHSTLEINYLPLLTQIYFIAVLHFYIGQHYGGVTIEQNFNFMLNQFERNINWLHKHDLKIQELFHRYLV
ncbi:homoserine kinase [Paenibacillus pabuli]|uniref:Homoserine kinase n=1 Tax=Paenibacillus pabuli TaxID=1472 RepID=A0ABX9BLG6_9BACL|nr:phosphotransferase [Paenibacillus pabuli]RAI97358.1 homoserine kinase [Paenibacillus pabuli]